MRKNIIKLDNSGGTKPLHFIPYRQNFPVTVEAGSTLEFKSNDAATLLYYIKSVGKDRASIQSEFDPDPGPEPGELTAIELNKKYSKLVFDTSYDPSADLATIYADHAGGGYGLMIVTTDWGLAVFDLQSQGLADSGYGMAMGETVIYSTVAFDDPVYHDHIERGWQNLVNGELVVDATETVNGIGQMAGLNPNASLWNGVWVGGVEAEPSTNYPIIVSINNGTYSGDTEISTDGTANVVLTANSGYSLPASITVSGASHTYDQSTGAGVISAPTSNVTITCSCEAIQYAITTSVTNGSYSGDTYVTAAQGGSVTITPASGYVLPASVTVTGADGNYTYDSTTGVVAIGAQVGAVSIACICEQDQPVPSMKAFAVGDTLVGGTSKLHVDTALASEAIYEWEGGVPRGKPVTLVKVGAVNCLVAVNSIGGFTITLNGAPLFADMDAKWTGLDDNGDIVISSSGEITEVNTTLQWGNGVYFFNK